MDLRCRASRSGPDTAVGLTQHFGLSPRWLDHVPFGGASGIVALRRAARAVQAGDADIVACVAADTNHVDSFRKTLSTFSRFAQDAVYPYGSGGANASFALITKNYMNSYGARREDFGKLCIAQRDNALSIPHALMKKKLTLDEYMSARPIADPIHLFDCVMPCAGAEAFLVCREDTATIARSAGRPHAVDRSSGTMPFRTIRCRCAAAGRSMSTSCGRWPGVTPADVDFVETYDDYPVIIDDAASRISASARKARGRISSVRTASPTTAPFRTTPRAGSSRSGRPARPAASLGLVEAMRQLAGTATRHARCPMPRSASFPASA